MMDSGEAPARNGHGPWHVTTRTAHAPARRPGQAQMRAAGERRKERGNGKRSLPGSPLPAIGPLRICAAIIENAMPSPVSPRTARQPAGPGTEPIGGVPVAEAPKPRRARSAARSMPGKSLANCRRLRACSLPPAQPTSAPAMARRPVQSAWRSRRHQGSGAVTGSGGMVAPGDGGDSSTPTSTSPSVK